MYKLLNETLTNEDFNKVDTLGAYGWLLQSFISWIASIPNDLATVYRGSELSKDGIEEYRHLIAITIRWHAFISTSRNKEVAEAYSANAIFIITLGKKDYNTHHEHNISSISQFQDDEQVLFVPHHNFIVQDVTGGPSNGTTGRWLIYLKCNHLVPMLPGE